MPELPEVETIRLQLDQALRGLKIVGVEVLHPKSFIGEIGEIRERRVRGVQRRGKMIFLELEGGKFLVIHLKLTGQLIYQGDRGNRGNQGELPNKFTRVIISFDNGGKLYFNDLRIFGWMRVIREIGEIGEIGVEPFDKEFTVEYLQKIFAKTGRPIKLVLMDQTKIAGIGNIYANEALFEAGIRPAKRAKELRDEDIKILRYSILEVLQEGIKYGGASAADEAYIKPDGTPGKYQEHFRAYQREGKKCRRCGEIIKRINLGGRGTFFCEKCQR